GGVGSAVCARLEEAGITGARMSLGLSQEVLDHASRGEILADAGLTCEGIVSAIRARVADWRRAAGARIASALAELADSREQGRGGELDLPVPGFFDAQHRLQQLGVVRGA